MRKLVLIVILFLSLILNTTSAQAYLPINIENQIRTWFNAAGKLVNFGNGTSALPGCSFAAGVLTCTGFDSPAAATTGGCVTLKEGSGTGTSTAKICAADNLAVSRTNTLNSDGRLKSQDVESSTSSEYGLDTRFNLSTGVLEGKINNVTAYLPTGTPALDANNTGLTAAIGANTMKCITFTARDSIIAATSLSSVVAVLGGNCSVCLYPDLDAGALIAPLTAGVASTAKDCTGTGTKTFTTDAFTLQEGTRYRLCLATDSALTRWYSAGYYAAVTANMVSTTAGTAATASASGKCGAITGALTTGDAYAPFVRVN
jgi:hypothetical protein